MHALHEHSTRRRDAGQATVEFALILPVLCLILFAIIEFGLAFWTYQQVSAAASEGARRGAVSRIYGDRDARIAAAVRDSSPNLSSGSLDVDSSSTWNAGDPLTVTVRYPEDITIMGVTFYHADLTVRRTSRVEQ